ncbi:MAG: terminase small subunit [Betaproteobacteria bacterium]
MFVDAYIAKHGNATAAAVAAGHAPGSAAEKAGYRLSKDVRVQAMLKERRAELLRAFQLESEAVHGVVAALVYARAVDILTPKQRKQLGPLTPELEMAIVGFRFDAKTGRIVEVKFADKNAALEKAMKHLGLFKADNKQKADAFSEFLKKLGENRDGLAPGSRASENGKLLKPMSGESGGQFAPKLEDG